MSPRNRLFFCGPVVKGQGHEAQKTVVSVTDILSQLKLHIRFQCIDLVSILLLNV